MVRQMVTFLLSSEADWCPGMTAQGHLQANMNNMLAFIMAIWCVPLGLQSTCVMPG